MSILAKTKYDFSDFIGQRFGRLEVIEADPDAIGPIASRSSFICKCDCGTIRSFKARNLLNGSQSCGCLRKDKAREATIGNLTGKRFGRWLVKDLEPNFHKKDTSSWWNCVCDCGTERVVKSWSLTSGKSLSCGCLHKEIVGLNSSLTKRTHGETGTRLYNIWSGMKLRCYDPGQERYKDYGGRGITVCDEWKTSYEAFRDWALSNGYANDLTIERMDVDGNYTPENCKFITRAEQARNKRSTIKLTAWGETKPLKDWLDDSRCKVTNENTLRTRLKRGIDHESALGIPNIGN